MQPTAPHPIQFRRLTAAHGFAGKLLGDPPPRGGSGACPYAQMRRGAGRRPACSEALARRRARPARPHTQRAGAVATGHRHMSNSLKFVHMQPAVPLPPRRGSPVFEKKRSRPINTVRAATVGLQAEITPPTPATAATNARRQQDPLYDPERRTKSHRPTGPCRSWMSDPQIADRSVLGRVASNSDRAIVDILRLTKPN